MEQQLCPDCGRPKARTIHDVEAGHCPKWWAIFDPEADVDCQRHRGSITTPHITSAADCLNRIKD